MYEKILVALDHSPAAQTVFESALTLAKVVGSQLILLHVLSQDAEDSPLSYAPMTISYNPEKLEEYRQEWEKFEQECQEKLQSMAQQAQQEGVTAEFIQTTGHPGRTICQYAQERDADLIIMGRRGHSSLSEMVMGSVSSYVVHRSHCAVQIVQ